ncbi:MAG: GNAT family N-acetyltransferase [Alphaproteobacteria bacterium]|nr:GNAT family N-acetyltransferase [Alphaproteobacteria bacterium]
MRCVIKQYSQISAAEWDKFVYSSSMGWAYFLYDVMAQDRNANLTHKSFAIVDADNNDEILMIMQMHQSSKHPTASQLGLAKERLVSRWGYVLKDGLGKKQQHAVKSAFEAYVDGYMFEHNIRSFEADLAPLSVAVMDAKDCVNPLIWFNFCPNVRYTSVVDLSKPDDRMLADCEETTRQAIRKVTASGRYEVVEAKPNREDCQTFIRLHKDTYTRTGAQKSIIADSYHEHMFFHLIPQGVVRVFFLQDKQLGETIAAVSILIYKNTAYYWWGCSKNEKEVGVNKYLLFSVINIIRENFGRTGWFETGGAHLHKRSGKSKGLTDFKKCFGTTLRPIWCGKYDKLKPVSAVKHTWGRVMLKHLAQKLHKSAQKNGKDETK